MPALAQVLVSTAEQLKKHVQQTGVEFRFKAGSCRADEIKVSQLRCQPVEEALAVNSCEKCLHRLVGQG
jgi:3-deoxy-D-manno-octulosonic acid (KDO) 8-phosphate synthase